MSEAAINSPNIFSFKAQTESGDRISGTIDAVDASAAAARLVAMRLRVIEIEPANVAQPAESRASPPVRSEDFIAFNQQLVHLTQAGIPLGDGMRLIARDLRRGRLTRTIEAIAEDLDHGTPIGDAFAKHESAFPPLYARILAAGTRSGNLTAVLLSFGQHVELMARLRRALWRSLSYPLMVLLMLAIVAGFLSWTVIPQFQAIYQSFGMRIPSLSEAVFAAAPAVPWIAGACLLLILVAPVIWMTCRSLGWGPWVEDRVARFVPLVGPVLRMSMIARWCDAARIAVDAGMPLDQAIRLAGQVSRSHSLEQDSQLLIARLEAGQSLASENATPGRLRVLPATIPVAIDLSARHNNLSEALFSLTDLYDRQADARVRSVPAIITPTLMLMIAASIGLTIVALLLPMISLIEGMSQVR